jgi:hypothetical protein
MRSAVKCIALALVCALGAVAQTYDNFSVSYTVTLSNAQTALAIQLPAAGSNRTEITSLSVQCTANCPVRFEVNGAAANVGNATAESVRSINPESTPDAVVSAPAIQAWSGTGVPVGTVVSPVWVLPASSLVPFGGERVLITKTGVNVNYIVRIPSNHSGQVSFFVGLRVRR